MRILISIIFAALCVTASGQSRSTNDWVDFRSIHVNKWLQIAPGKMGPNALPVPDMDYAFVDTISSVETGIHGHFMEGDKAVNSYVSFYWAVVPGRVGMKIWGYPSETFKMDNTLRDERQVYWDDTGWMTNPGDLWINTYIQIVRGRKNWPDISIGYSAKTTTGWATHARYTDGAANYYYAAFGKSFFPKKGFLDEIRLAGLGGFYVWQTNKVEMAQDEGPHYEVGMILRTGELSFANEIGGYTGYDVYEYIGVIGDNDPLIYRSRLMKTGKRIEWKFEYQTGFKDYDYQTFRISIAYRFKLSES
ncbi:MAG: hypothetical protein JXR61_06865 [Prolixibacteraceae bacterium]|nr:hypothetical protein [Prolixibacteraceae bacterium]